MKIICIISGIIAAINVSAATPDDIENYSTFKSVTNQVSLLSKQEAIFPVTVDEINRLITGWQKEDIRKKSLALLKQNGLDIADSKQLVIIEWGGGGVPYRALYLAPAAFLVRESANRQLTVEKIAADKTGEITKDANFIRQLFKDSQYQGNITGVGYDVRTYIVTVLDGAAKEKTAVIYGTVEIDIYRGKDKTDQEKDTVAVYKSILSIKKSCGIKPESGA